MIDQILFFAGKCQISFNGKFHRTCIICQNLYTNFQSLQMSQTDFFEEA